MSPQFETTYCTFEEKKTKFITNYLQTYVFGRNTHTQQSSMQLQIFIFHFLRKMFAPSNKDYIASALLMFGLFIVEVNSRRIGHKISDDKVWR